MVESPTMMTRMGFRVSACAEAASAKPRIATARLRNGIVPSTLWVIYPYYTTITGKSVAKNDRALDLNCNSIIYGSNGACHEDRNLVRRHLSLLLYRQDPVGSGASRDRLVGGDRT